jgi:S1-C subfamily serine protease
MKKFVGYVLVFVIGFVVCALVLRGLYGPTSGSSTQDGVLVTNTTAHGAPNVVTNNGNPITAAAKKLERSVVNIDTVGRPIETGFPDFFGFGAPKQEVPKGQASGIIYRSDGYIVTNNHVVEGTEQVYVTLADKKRYKAQVIGRDPRSDLAVIKIPATGLPAATFATADALRELQVGDWVIAVGNPLGLGSTVTAGIVSATNRDVEGTGMEDMIQTDAPINRGNSGGALADIDGTVIGINTAIASTNPGGGSIGIGFARRSSIVRDVADKIIKQGKVIYPWLGIKYIVLNDEMKQQLKAQGEPVPPVMGALIKEVVPGSPADKAGLLGYDVITEINGKKVAEQKDVSNTVRSSKVGQIVDLTVWHARTGQTSKIAVRMAEMPEGL